MMRMLLVALLVLGVLGGVAGAQPPPRSCEEERDHARILARMLGDQRGNLELQYAEALVRLQRAEAELAKLKVPKPEPKP